MTWPNLCRILSSFTYVSGSLLSSQYILLVSSSSSCVNEVPCHFPVLVTSATFLAFAHRYRIFRQLHLHEYSSHQLRSWSYRQIQWSIALRTARDWATIGRSSRDQPGPRNSRQQRHQFEKISPQHPSRKSHHFQTSSKHHQYEQGININEISILPGSVWIFIMPQNFEPGSNLSSAKTCDIKMEGQKNTIDKAVVPKSLEIRILQQSHGVVHCNTLRTIHGKRDTPTHWPLGRWFHSIWS